MTEHPDIARLREGPLTPEIEAHLATCPRCRVEARLLARVAAMEADPVPGEVAAAMRAVSALGQATLTGSIGGPAQGSLSVGEVVDRYRVEARAGAGGMGVVYRVRHERLGSLHALKVVAGTSAHERQRLEREGRAQGALRHPNIVAVTDIVDVHGAPGLILDWVDGPSVAEWLKEEDAVPLEVADRWARGILRGLAAAHRLGFVHRDLKPANVLLAHSDDGWEPRIADFGLVRALDDATEITRTGAAMGTPSYMAPEQIRDAGSADARSDVFSLGALLYELLTGRRAFVARSPVDQYERVRSGEYPPVEDLVPHLPERVKRTIARALRPDPTERFADAHEMLEAWIGEAPPTRGRVDRRVWFGMGALAVVALVAGLVTLQRASEPLPAPVDRKLFGGSNVDEIKISGDGRSVVLLGDGVWSLDPDDGSTRRIAEVAGLSGDFFPDGRRVAVLADDGVWSVTLDGEAERLLPVPGRMVVVSPDGNSLALSDEAGVWLIPLDGAPRRLLVPEGGTSVVGVTWSPSGRFLATAHIDTSTRDGWLQVTAIDGSVSRRLNVGSRAYNLVGTWPLEWVAPDRLMVAVHEEEDTILRVFEGVEQAGAVQGMQSADLYRWEGQELQSMAASSAGERLVYLRASHTTSVMTVAVDGGAQRPLPGLASDRRLAGAWHSAREVLVCDEQAGEFALYAQPIDTPRASLVADDVASCRIALVPGAMLLWRWDEARKGVVLVHAGAEAAERELARFSTSTPPAMRCVTTPLPRCVVAALDGTETRFSWLDPESGRISAPFLGLADTDSRRGWDLSPDGSVLAVAHRYDTKRATLELHPVDGGQATVADARMALPQSVAWDLRGDRLYVTGMFSSAGPLYTLVEVHLDGTGRELWTSADRWVTSPSPSPDGSHVAAITMEIGSEPRLLETGLALDRPLPRGSP